MLIAILLPAVMRVRFVANRAVCASNLRQIGALLHAYANDNHGEIPAMYAGYDGTSGEPPRPTAYFHGQVYSTMGVGLLLSPPIGRAQRGYVRSAQIFICPGELAAEDNAYRVDGGDGFVWFLGWPDRLPNELGGMSYCYNYVPEGGDWYQYRYGMWGIKEEPQWRRGDFAGLERHNLGRAASKALMVERPLYVYDNYKPDRQHEAQFCGRGGNVLYMDEHVSWVPADDVRRLSRNATGSEVAHARSLLTFLDRTQ